MQIAIDVSNSLLNLYLRRTTYNPPAQLWLGLLTTLPAADGTGSIEATGTNYTRMALTFGAAVNRASSNSTQITFPQASTNWGTVIGIAVYEAQTGGSPKLWQSVTSLAVTTGKQVRIAVNGLTVQNT